MANEPSRRGNFDAPGLPRIELEHLARFGSAQQGRRAEAGSTLASRSYQRLGTKNGLVYVVYEPES